MFPSLQLSFRQRPRHTTIADGAALSCMHASSSSSRNQGKYLLDPSDREAAGKREASPTEGGRPGPATPAREAVAPLSVGLGVAAMAVATVEQQQQQRPDVVSAGRWAGA